VGIGGNEVVLEPNSPPVTSRAEVENKDPIAVGVEAGVVDSASTGLLCSSFSGVSAVSISASLDIGLAARSAFPEDLSLDLVAVPPKLVSESISGSAVEMNGPDAGLGPNMLPVLLGAAAAAKPPLLAKDAKPPDDAADELAGPVLGAAIPNTELELPGPLG
jgi:hypothetical protein